MRELSLVRGRLQVGISPNGGALRHFRLRRGAESLDLMRPYSGTVEGFDVLKSSGFPFVPFGNRVRENRFRFRGREYRLHPNQEWDPLYLHGDAWLGTWIVESNSVDSAELSYAHDAAAGAPYAYRATERFELDEQGVVVRLSIRNESDKALPFGTGFHPFFPMNSETRLRAAAESYWEEEGGYMPSRRLELPEELDFNVPRRLPSRWTNNQFDGWDGEATIVWPDRRLRLSIRTEPAFKWYFVFVSSVEFDPDFKHDFFCFEPMSHPVDDHHNSPFRGLEILKPGESLTKTIHFDVIDLG